MKKGFLAVLTGIGGAVGGAVYAGSKESKKKEKQKVRADRNRNIIQMLFRWIEIKQESKTFASYFEKNGYKTIAIYGMGDVGSRFYDELKDSSIQVKYAIDKKADSIYAELELLTPEDELPPVDVIVVTPFNFYDEIEEELMEITDNTIISIEDVVYDI